MSKFTLERSSELVNEVVVALRAWEANKDSDSVRVQRLRRSELTWASRILEELVYDVQPNRRLCLTVGEVGVKASSFRKGAYDFYSEHEETLEPGSQLTFERADHYGYRRDYELFVGDYSLLVAVSSLAKTLRGGSQLEVVEYPN